MSEEKLLLQDDSNDERDHLLNENMTLESLGSIVREEREKQNLSISYLADETKIRQSYLEGIESGKLEGFYGNVYRRGFVKNYLRKLGREDLWSHYDSLLKEEIVSKVEETTPPLGDFTPPAKGFKKGSRKGIITLLLVVIAISSWYVWDNRDSIRAEVARIQREQAEQAEEAERKAKLAKAQEEAARAAEAAKAEEAARAASEDMKIAALRKAQKPVLIITAKKDSWLRITREGERLFGGTLKAGAKKAIEGSGRIYAIYGSPENLSVSWKGEKRDIMPSNGTGPVHFLYSLDGSQKVLTPQQAEGIWKKTDDVKPEVKAEEKKEENKGPLTLTLRADKGNCWMMVTSKGKKLFAGTLKKGTEKDFKLTDPVKVKYGNPSVVTALINGEEIARPGTKGQITRVLYSKEGKPEKVSK